MARYLYAYKLNTDTQQSLFYSSEGKLNLDVVTNELNNNLVTIQHGRPANEGFSAVREISMGDIQSLEAFCIIESSLGNYFEAVFTENTFTSIPSRHRYFTKAKVFLTENNDFIMMFENSTEEKGKAGVNKNIKRLNFQIESFKITDSLIRNLQNNFVWTAASFNKIVKLGDSTRRVSFDIDPANTTDVSLIQTEYSDHGDLSHLKFSVPYIDQGTDKTITVKLYEDKNRIIIDEEEFSTLDSFNEFVLYLMDILNTNS